MKILEEFKTLLIPITEEERSRLEESILSEGCRDALIVWKKGKDTILVDGHNRYEICERQNIPYKTKNKDFVDEDEAKLFIISNQLSRRNLTPFNKAILALKMKNSIQEKARQNLSKSKGRGKKGSMISSKVNTNELLSKAAGVSPQTLSRVEEIQRKGSKEQIEKLKKGEVTVGGL